MVMLQQYDEAVEVRAAGGTPEHFLWRGRLWRVCAVLSQWIETAAWWRTDPADAGWGPERNVYRVEAGSGRYARTETFDLAFDPTSDRWQLERVTGR
jgi:Domain of unknown function (DUF6504)